MTRPRITVPIRYQTDVYRDGVTGLQNTAASKSVSSSQQYESDMKVAIDRKAGAQIAGVNAGAGEASGGYRRAASEARGGVEQNYRKELDANKTVYVSQVDAAGMTRDGGNQAASLLQAAAVIAAVGREISREVGQGMHSLDWVADAITVEGTIRALCSHSSHPYGSAKSGLL